MDILFQNSASSPAGNLFGFGGLPGLGGLGGFSGMAGNPAFSDMQQRIQREVCALNVIIFYLKKVF